MVPWNVVPWLNDDRRATELHHACFRGDLGAVRQLASNCSALLKGRYTLIAGGGHPVSINATGSPVLATAGSGDVLAGILGALMARGLSVRDAARVAAYVHGKAGEALQAQGREGHIASDLCDPVSSYLGARSG